MKPDYTLITRSHSKNIFGCLITRSYWQQLDFWLACVAAVIFWLSFRLLEMNNILMTPLTNTTTQLYFLVIIFPILEEIVFRGLIQESIQNLLEYKEFKNVFLWHISNANLITSLCFSISHFWSHSAHWAIAILVPSLIFGYFKDKYQYLYPSILLHIFYNLVFYVFL